MKTKILLAFIPFKLLRNFKTSPLVLFLYLPVYFISPFCSLETSLSLPLGILIRFYREGILISLLFVFFLQLRKMEAASYGTFNLKMQNIEYINGLSRDYINERVDIAVCLILPAGNIRNSLWEEQDS